MIFGHFFIQLVIILISARCLGEIAAKYKIPAVIGELLAGVLIGPSMLAWIEPNDTIKLLAEIGIVLLLFEVGLEANVSSLLKSGPKAALAAFSGVIAPLFLGYLVSYYLFHLELLPSLFIGSTLTATSIGITLRVLSDLKQQGTKETQIVLGAAMLDDIIGIVLLALLFEFAESGQVNVLNAGSVGLFIFLFLILAPFLAKILIFLIKKFDEISAIPGLLPTSVVSLILFFAYLAHLFGAPELLGGFAAGLALSPHFFLPFSRFFDFNEGFAKKIEKKMKPIVHLFTPIFFVTVGLSLNLREVDWSSSFVWVVAFVLLLVAVIGKLSSGWILIKESFFTRMAVGIAMIPRGEVGLIFADVGRNRGIFDHDLYAALIAVISLTTVLTPLFMRLFFSYYPNPEEQKRE